MKPHHILISILIGVALCGCVANKVAKRLTSDSSFQRAAEKLTRDFLDGQKGGESGRVAAQRYGSTGSFYNLVDYRIEGFGHEFGQPAVFFRVKAGNRVGGVTWTDYRVLMRHDPKLEATGDDYKGLRIRSVSETLQSSLSR